MHCRVLRRLVCAQTGGARHGAGSRSARCCVERRPPHDASSRDQPKRPRLPCVRACERRTRVCVGARVQLQHGVPVAESTTAPTRSVCLSGPPHLLSPEALPWRTLTNNKLIREQSHTQKLPRYRKLALAWKTCNVCARLHYFISCY